MCLFLGAAGGLAQVVTEEQVEVGNIFPTAPRELRQNLSRAQEAIAEERYSDAADELGQILNDAASDDYFLGRPGQPDAQLSLKTQALSLIGSMPAKGRQIFETKFGFDAKAELDKALEAGSLQQVTGVSRRYFHTKAGYEATLLVGRTQLDQGRPLAAALTLKRIADSPSAAALYDPELSVLLATCWLHARMPEKATETLVALRQRMPQARVKLLDGEESLFSSDDQALGWLEQIVGGGRTPLVHSATQWVLFRGNETRNASTAGGVPLLNYRWNVPTINDPQDELKIKSLSRGLRDRGEPNIVALQPLVVQDSVIMRAPDSSKLIGVDLRTGKRQWVFPPFDDSPELLAARSATAPRSGNSINLREQELQQRVWDDHAFGQVSSDGQQVYVLDELSYAPGGQMSNRMNVVIGARGQPIVTSGTKPYNLLVALDLKKEGYQSWGVGGATGDAEPGLAGAFFLGPPLPVGDQLYALAEMNSEVRLVCLSAKNGALEWKQQLAVVEDNQLITFDQGRRLAGASPSLSDGVLICPTSAGAVVAVDLATRSLRWGYQYARSDVYQRSGGPFGMRTTLRQPAPGQTQWIDATATIADGAVILTPVESQELHCLDVLTGKAKWPPQPRDDMLFVACVHKGRIVLVGKDKVKAVNLSDGQAAWKEPLALKNENGDTSLAAGRGFYTDKFYYLPLAGGQLVKIDLEEGTIISRAKTEIDLGNVVCYKDQLISQSAQHVASFFLTEPLLAWIDETLKADPDNAKALSLKGQVLLQEGKRTESLDLLRRAVAKSPQDLAARSLLVKVMLSLLRDDFATNFHLAEELDSLVTDPVQRREVLRWRAQGLAKAGKTWEAFTALAALADAFDAEQMSIAGGSAVLESTERELSVRPDRWLQGQLAALARVADDQVRQKMHDQVQTRLDRAMAADSAADLRLFVNLYGFHPLARRARLALADKLVAADQLLEAELLAGELVDDADRPIAAQACATLAAVYEKARRFEVAARYYQRLGQHFSDVVCRDGMTGAQLAARASGPSMSALVAGQWPAGRAEVAVAEAEGRVARSTQYAVTLAHFGGAALRGLRASVDAGSSGNITIRDDLGRVLTTASVRPDGNFRRYVSSYYLNSGNVNGHLVVVNLGDQVIAIDALKADRTGGDGLLWRLDAMELDLTNVRPVSPAVRQATNPLAGIRVQIHDPTGRLNFYTGPVQSIGVCFQKGRQLICADPLTGQPIWERAQIPAAAEIFGDGELLFVADPNSEEALVLSAIDGSVLGRRQLERADRRWATHGRNVLTWEQTGASVTLKLYDAWTQGPPLWSKQVPLGSRGTLVDGEELALLESGGTFTVVSLATGKVRFASPLAAERSLSFIHVIRSQDQYLLIASQENNDSADGLVVHPITMLGGLHQNRVHGRVYAFDRRTGKAQWQVPALVASHCLPPDQPAESPLLCFVRNRTRTSGSTSSRQAGSVLCLDRRDGRIVWDSDAEQAAERRIPGEIKACEILADPAKRTVTLGIQSQPSGRSVTIQLTDKPMPPQPPAQTGEFSSSSAKALAGVVDRSIDAAFELLGRGLNPGVVPRAIRPRAIGPRGAVPMPPSP
jgi:outer membrane protein assembly factor BamB